MLHVNGISSRGEAGFPLLGMPLERKLISGHETRRCPPKDMEHVPSRLRESGKQSPIIPGVKTLAQTSLKPMVLKAAISVLTKAFEAGSGLRLNGYLSHLCGVRVYGDAFVFRWDPQQYGPDGRAKLIDTEENFIEITYNGTYVPKLLCNFCKGVKL